ncbi:ABC transporter ATP-binding protein [Citrobacter amalonaticus]|nr:ABC transporter ATP-binding protein [Citrobacter amalonaticus]
MIAEQHQEILRTEGLSKFFPGVKALDNVDFSLRRGEIMALLGENGAGKSTLIKALTGVYHADRGSIWLEGSAISPQKYRTCPTAGHWHGVSGSEPAAEYVGGG